MFDIGWSEMAVIALIALIVIGPKELPNAMRSVAKWIHKARSLAREFQSGIDEVVREADLDEARKAFDATKTFDVDQALEDTIDPTGSLRDEAGDLQDAVRSAASAEGGGGKPPGTGEAAEVTPSEPETAESDATEAAGKAEPNGPLHAENPVSIAPPHSLTPPPEEPEAVTSDETSAPGRDGSQPRA